MSSRITPDHSIRNNFLYASQRGNLSELETLRISHDITDWTQYQHDVTGDTALHLAAREGHLNVVKYLCGEYFVGNFRAEVTNKDTKRPIHEAAQFARLPVLDYLLNAKVEVDPLKRADWTPLMLACTKDSDEATGCVKLLLENGANTVLRNKDGWTPFLIACRTGNAATVQLLMDSRPNSVSDRSNNGRTPLQIAAFGGNRDVMDLLLATDERIALIDRRDSSGSTPLLESAKSSRLNVVERLIEFGADVTAVDDVGQNVLHVAAGSGNIETVRFIMKNKLVPIDSRSCFGLTPLTMAKRSRNQEVVDLLISLGAVE